MTDQPAIFQPIFAESWPKLPAVMHKHYANRPFTSDVVTAEGVMKIELSWFARLLAPLLWLSGALLPYAGENIPATVHFKSEPNGKGFCFDCIFYVPGKRPCHFRSRMVPAGGDQIIEYMPNGIG